MAIAGGGKPYSKGSRGSGLTNSIAAITSSLDVHVLLVQGLPGCELHQLIDGLRVVDKASFNEAWRSFRSPVHARNSISAVNTGSVGTGFKQREAAHLRQTLDKLATRSAPVAYNGRRKNIQWCLPTLIGEIEYRVWTTDGKLRQASYKGLRELRDNAAIYKIDD